jgi:DNA-3-methyladenine glycosylase I
VVKIVRREPRLGDGLVRDDEGVTRCWWSAGDSLYRRYHDTEWGSPVSDDRRLFEKICLEGFQAGLSWLTILRKRPNFRRAFAGFDVNRVARFGGRDVARLLQDEGIIRHRGKIESTINNAKRASELREEFGSLAAYFWRWEPEARSRPRRMTRGALTQLARVPESIALSKDLKRRGWTFVGPTTIYAFMEAMGLVNDHLDGCASRSHVEKLRAAFRRPGAAGRRIILPQKR